MGLCSAQHLNEGGRGNLVGRDKQVVIMTARKGCTLGRPRTADLSEQALPARVGVDVISREGAGEGAR